MRAVVKHNGSPLLDALTKFMLKSIFSGIWSLWKMMKIRKRTVHSLKAVGGFFAGIELEIIEI